MLESGKKPFNRVFCGVSCPPSKAKCQVRFGFALALVVGSISGCASHTPVRSDQAQSYQGLVPSGENVMSIPPQPGDFGQYRFAIIDPVLISPAGSEEISPEVGAEVLGVLQDKFHNEMQKQFYLSGGEGVADPILRVKVRITRITEASPVLNTLTSLAIGPLLNGALAVELEAVDGVTGQQKAMLLWADSGGIKEFFGNYSRSSHALTLAARFSVEATQFLSPFGRPLQ
nr:DUF3313 family protein [Pseudomonas sp. NBRC 111137]